MPASPASSLGRTECRGSMQRVGPRRQIPGTFRRLPDGEGGETEFWRTYCDRCATTQAVIDHVMVRHDTQGRAYDATRNLPTRNPRRHLHRTPDWFQPEFQLEPETEPDDGPIPF